MPWPLAGVYSDEFQDVRGRGMPNMEVEVWTTGATPVLATLYTDETKSVEADNPFLTDAYGNGVFYADPGEYDLIANGLTIRDQVQIHPTQIDLSDGTEGDSLVIEDGLVVPAPLISVSSAHPSPRSQTLITKHSVDDLQTSLTVPYYTVPADMIALGVNVGVGFNNGVGSATIDWYITPQGHVGAPDPEHRIARSPSAAAGAAFGSIVAGALALPEGWSVWAVATAAGVVIEALANEYDAAYAEAIGWDTAVVQITDAGGGDTAGSLYLNEFDRFCRFQAGYIHNLGGSTVVVQHQVDRGAGPVTIASTSISANSQSAFSSNVVGLATGEEHLMNVVTPGGSVSVYAAVFAP